MYALTCRQLEDDIHFLYSVWTWMVIYNELTNSHFSKKENQISIIDTQLKEIIFINELQPKHGHTCTLQ